MEWTGEMHIFWFLHGNSGTPKCHYKRYTLFSVSRGVEKRRTWAFSSLLCLWVAELAASLGVGKPFQDRSLVCRSHRFHIPGRPFGAACPALCPLQRWTGLDPLHLPWRKDWGPLGPWSRGPSLQSWCFDSCPGQWGQVTHNKNNLCVFRMGRPWILQRLQ